MRYLTLILAGLLIVGCQSRESTVFSGQTIEISDTTLTAGCSDTVRFGRLHSGELGVKHLHLRNASSQTLVITRHEVSCQCVRPEFERKPIKPGEEIPFDLRFDSRGEYGWQMKLLKLYNSESSAPLKIYVEADVY
ncbi:DUF1573 domain-containing protein [uncultured Alistipes sp.]|uniref:DUF1573 domain-containing protein n=1 Tax=uncultured Alistipes sp. TaxID=538949 RepID=UPI00262FA3E7|nr:DUF1573 domain-containing protein [uncultured Alistipes sp.]